MQIDDDQHKGWRNRNLIGPRPARLTAIFLFDDHISRFFADSKVYKQL